MRTPIYSFDSSEMILSQLRARVRRGDQDARRQLFTLSDQYRRDLRVGRLECPFFPS